MGGFECSTHRLPTGVRLDLIASTLHDKFAKEDYQRLKDVGMATARDGIRWHLIERVPNEYDMSSLALQVAAARDTGVEIIWDLFHYGYPDDLDIITAEFVERFAKFSAAVAIHLRGEIGRPLLLCPANEISFYSWAGGEVGAFYPVLKKRGADLKMQLVRSAVAAIHAIRLVCPDSKFIHVDPAIHVFAGASAKKETRDAAERYRLSQFEALDMIVGQTHPDLGGSPDLIDVIGINYYPYNQWFYPSGRKILRGHKNFRPVSEILGEFYERYHRPLFIAETGTEDEERPEWFKFVASEVETARELGIPVEGICLYPILNHPGWSDDRHCHNGLWDYADERGLVRSTDRSRMRSR